MNSYARAKQKSATCLEKRFKTNKDITKSFPSCGRESHKESASALLRLTLLLYMIGASAVVVCDYEQTVCSNRTSQVCMRPVGGW